MAKFVKQYKPTRQVQAYAKKIAFAWHSAIEGILDAGRLLDEAHEKLGRKAWLDMVNNDLPFQRRTAEKLRTIAGDKRLTDRRYVEHLPPRWTTLHELTYLSDSQFKDAIKKRKIHPDMERREAEELTAGNKRPAKPKKRAVISRNGAKTNGTNGTQLFVSGEDETNQLAVLTAGRELSDEEATRLEDELNKLSEEFGFSFTFSGYSSQKDATKGMRANLAKAQRRWMKRNAGRYNVRGKILREMGTSYTPPGPYGKTMTEEEVVMIDEAIRQIEIGKYFRKDSDGSFHPYDIRNPDNPYHEWYLAKKDKNVEWDPTEMYDHCASNMIITRYTPLEFVDYFGYLEFLVFEHSVGNAKQRKWVEAELKRLARKEQEIRDAQELSDRLGHGGAVDNETYRDPMLNRIYDFDPGYAEAAHKILVR